MPRMAIIGGSGFYSVPGCRLREKRTVNTKYGEATLFFYENEKGMEFVFLPRHGESHTCAPHKINYRANIMALQGTGVERIIGLSSVGSMREAVKPGDFVLLDQFLDFTKTRPITFFDEEGCVAHTDMTEPYCGEMRSCILSAPRDGIRLHNRGTYVCAEGPRFETAAEIRMFTMLGGDVVGMTGVPEVVLARELGMCYSGISVATNYAAGVSKAISHEEVLMAMKQIESLLASYVVGCLAILPIDRTCTCRGTPGKID
ncbi:MAG TPA: S-methyl-5'-thioinosine phosphorylase [Methanocella sp.]|nr:S-methyl-5'-thioinosine phosphorylase [Methanocella sp.]